MPFKLKLWAVSNPIWIQCILLAVIYTVVFGCTNDFVECQGVSNPLVEGALANINTSGIGRCICIPTPADYLKGPYAIPRLSENVSFLAAPTIRNTNFIGWIIDPWVSKNLATFKSSYSTSQSNFYDPVSDPIRNLLINYYTPNCYFYSTLHLLDMQEYNNDHFFKHAFGQGFIDAERTHHPFYIHLVVQMKTCYEFFHNDTLDFNIQYNVNFSKIIRLITARSNNTL
jgi:hypothetical protein